MMNNKTCYINDINSNSLVVNDITYDYRIRMLESNRIQGLLDASVVEDEGIKEVRYDISSRTSLTKRLMTGTLTAREIKTIIKSIAGIVDRMNKYLLVASDLVTDPDYIYMENGGESIEFCYVPGHSENFSEGLSQLLRAILGSVDKEDHEAVVLAYNLYQESLKENYVMEDLERVVNS